MIGDAIALFRARRDPALAARLARDMAVDGVIDRASWPLVILKFWLGVALLILVVLTGLLIWAAFATTTWLLLPAALPGGLAYLIVRLWRGLDAGKAQVVAFAKAQAARAQQSVETRLRKPPPPLQDAP